MTFSAPTGVALADLTINLDGNYKEDFFVRDKGFSATSHLDWSSSKMTFNNVGEGFNGSVILNYHKIGNLWMLMESPNLEFNDMDITIANIEIYAGSVYVGVPTTVGAIKAIAKQNNGQICLSSKSHTTGTPAGTCPDAATKNKGFLIIDGFSDPNG
jgi:hypothetical protein